MEESKEKEYIVKIETLTPLWTGDVNREMKSIRESGIIGSLRWWYEALIRGLVGNACDPTAENNRCEGQKHCMACELFGCTGWARKFKLEVKGSYERCTKITVPTKRDDQGQRICDGVMGRDIMLRFIPLREVADQEWWLLRKTLEIIESYGAIGGRIAQGNGVIKIDKNSEEQNNIFKQQWQVAPIKRVTDEKDNNVPDLGQFFCTKYQIEFKKEVNQMIEDNDFWMSKVKSGISFVPIAFHIRDAIRRCIEEEDKRHLVFGERSRGSKVFVSHGYEVNGNTVEIRVFGFGVDEETRREMGNKIGNKWELGEYLRNEENKDLENKDLIENISVIEEKMGQEIIGEIRGLFK